MDPSTSTPIPKPRTRFNLNTKNLNETSAAASPLSVDVSSSNSTSIYPNLSPFTSTEIGTTGDGVTKVAGLVAPPKPPRGSPDLMKAPSPPERPPPPAGWNVNPIQPSACVSQHRVAPPPPGPPPPLPKLTAASIVSPASSTPSPPSGSAPLAPSSTSSNTTPSPPSADAPAPPSSTPSPPSKVSHPPPPPPPRPIHLNSVVPLVESHHYATVKPLAKISSLPHRPPPPVSTESSPGAFRVVENPTYLSLSEYRNISAMPGSTSNESGFYSIASPVKASAPQLDTFAIYDNVANVYDELESTVEDFTGLTGSIEIASEDDILSAKSRPPQLSVPTSARLSIDNAYTPPPKKADFPASSPTRGIIDESTDAEAENDMETEGILLDGTDDDDDFMEGSAVSYFGFVAIHVGKKERKRAHARLKNMQLAFHEDEETSDYLSGPFQLVGCQLICRQESTISIRLNEMESQKTVVFTVDDSPETWSLLLGECWLSQYELLRSSVSDISTCGTVWMKQGTASGWQRAALCLVGRCLHYALIDSSEYIFELDIRKVLAAREKVEKELWCPQVKKKNSHGPFMMTLKGCSLFIECDDEWTTSLWYKVVSDVLSATPHSLDDYRLTCDNVPVIVDKCIRFIAAFGMSSEGLYRRNGQLSETNDILTQLTTDQCGVHLVPSTGETVYAVADALRQFFRRLPAPLFPDDCHQRLFECVAATCEPAERFSRLREVLQSLPVVNYSTLRRLMSHLKEVTSNSAENRASVENLARVFAPTLFERSGTDLATVAAGGPCFKDNSSQSTVIAILVAAYDQVFEVTSHEEMCRDIVDQVQRMKTPQKSAAVRANGLLVPIHLLERENRPFNVKTDLAAEEVCREAVVKRGFEAAADGKYALFEVVRGGSLSRRIPVSERLAASVINRWIPWNCFDGFLLFARDEQGEPTEEDMCSFSGKIKLAEPGSKSYKSFELRVEGGTKVVAYKHEKVWKEWSVEDTVWYYGAENNRKAPYTFNLTFIIVDGTSFRDKLVGFCVSFKGEAERRRFLNRVYYVQGGCQPPPLVHI